MALVASLQHSGTSLAELKSKDRTSYHLPIPASSAAFDGRPPLDGTSFFSG